MGEIVNLNKTRKAQDRLDHKRQAAANRARFGRDKATVTAERLADARRAALLDGARAADDKDHE